MKLKTSRDLEEPIGVLVEGGIIPQKLKQEAINWVKEDRRRHGVTFQGEFWQENLNITEEDLE